MRPEVVYAFPDTHSAIGGEKALLDAGVAVRVMPRPSALGDGCGICLRVDEADAERAGAVMRGAGIAVGAVFLKRRADGRTSYTALRF